MPPTEAEKTVKKHPRAHSSSASQAVSHNEKERQKCMHVHQQAKQHEVQRIACTRTQVRDAIP